MGTQFPNGKASNPANYRPIPELCVLAQEQVRTLRRGWVGRDPRGENHPRNLLIGKDSDLSMLYYSYPLIGFATSLIDTVNALTAAI